MKASSRVYKKGFFLFKKIKSENLFSPIKLFMTGLLIGIYLINYGDTNVENDFSDIVKLSCDKQLRISNIHKNKSEVYQYDKFELTFELTGKWNNPFDPGQIQVDGYFTAPDGKKYVVPGFFYQDYELTKKNGEDHLKPIGDPVWKIRFTPRESGKFTYQIEVRNQGKEITANVDTFLCKSGTSNDGFIRVSKSNPHYFSYDSGKPFFAVGHNLSTAGGNYFTVYNGWMKELANAGGNIFRQWWCSSLFNLESSVTEGRQNNLKIGEIDLESAWYIERTVDEAENLGLHVMACFETQQYLRKGKSWEKFTYNTVNGGPVATPADFFTNSEAKRRFKQRLRYIVSRWGYSTAIFSWQLFNEVNSCNDFNVHPVAEWHAEMADYLKSTDPHKHMVHTNFGNLNGYPEIDSLKKMEIVSTNIYYSRDAALTSDWTRTLIEAYKKPYLLTEFGIARYNDRDTPEDTTGIMLHNALWGQMMTGSAGTGMAWWWETWIDRFNLYPLYRIFSGFIKDIPFDRYSWEPVVAKSLKFKGKELRTEPGPTIVDAWRRNFRPAGLNENLPVFIVSNDGSVTHREYLMSMVYADPPNLFLGSKEFLINWPVDGSCVVYIPETTASETAKLKVDLDGRTVLHEPLKVTDNLTAFPGEDYRKAFSFPVAKGEHRISIQNTGKNWFAFMLLLENQRLNEGPDLQVRGLKSDDWIMLWLRHPLFNWMCQTMGENIETQPSGILTLQNIKPGKYQVVWLNTLNGSVLKEEEISSDGTLICETPPVAASVACRMHRIK